jgi:hypothetical protein
MKVVCNFSKGCQDKSCTHYCIHKKDDSCTGIEVPCETHGKDIVWVTCIPANEFFKKDSKIYDKNQKALV